MRVVLAGRNNPRQRPTHSGNIQYPSLETLQRGAAYMTPGVGDYMAAQDAGGNYRNALSQLGRGEYLNAASSTARGLADTLSIIPGAGDAAAGAAKGLPYIAASVLPAVTKFGPEMTAGLIDDAGELAAKGFSPKEITKQTEIFKSHTGEWMSQFSNADAKVNPGWFQEFNNWKPRNTSTARQLSNVYKSDELYSYYPRFASEVEVVMTTDVKYAQFKFDPETGSKRIRVNPKAIKRKAREEGRDPDELIRSIMAHEIDHVIQAEEMLPSGSNVAWIENQIKELPESRKLIDRYKRIISSDASPAKKAEAKELLAETERHVQFFERFKPSDAGKLYTQTLGEADAFWTGAMHWDPDVATKLPMHNDRTQGRQLLDITSDGVPQTAPFDPSEAMITSAYDNMGRGIASDIDLFHASPHFFDKFDLKSSFGSGEGASMVGHGLYLSESAKVSGPKGHYTKIFQSILDHKKGQLETRIRALEGKLAQPRGVSSVEAMQFRNNISDMKKQLADTDWNATSYKVHVPDKYVSKMLRWDKPLNKQPQNVQAAIKKVWRKLYDEPLDRMSSFDGGAFYKDLSETLGSDEAASAFLSKNGIPGAKYLDGDSRNLTYGTHNYVVYDDSITEITHRTRGGKTEVMGKAGPASDADPTDFGKFKQKKELKDFHNKMQNNIMEQAKGVRRLAAEWLENNNDTAIAKGTRVLSKQGNNIEITSGPMFNKRKGEVFYMVKYRDRAGDMQESSMPHWALKEFKVFGGPK